MDTKEVIDLTEGIANDLKIVSGHLRKNNVPDTNANNAITEINHVIVLLQMLTQLDRFVAKHGEIK